MLTDQYRVLEAAGDWSAISTLLSDSFVGEDRRRGVVQPSRFDRRWFFDQVADLAAAGVEVEVPRIIGLRGADRALAHSTFVSSGTVVDLLTVAECNAIGQVTRLIMFDTVDLRLAVRTLDGLFMADLPEPMQESLLPGARLIWASTAGDVEGMAAVLTDDFLRLDYREPDLVPMSGAEIIDRAEVLKAHGAEEEVVDFVTKVHAVSHRAAVASRSIATPETVDDLITDVVLSVVSDGRLRTLECYPEAELPRAMRRFHEASAGSEILCW